MQEQSQKQTLEHELLFHRENSLDARTISEGKYKRKNQNFSFSSRENGTRSKSKGCFWAIFHQAIKVLVLGLTKMAKAEVNFEKRCDGSLLFMMVKERACACACLCAYSCVANENQVLGPTFIIPVLIGISCPHRPFPVVSFSRFS